MKNIFDYKKSDLEQYLLECGEKKFKALQIFEWLYIKKIKSFSKMTNIKKELQESLAKNITFDFIEIVRKQEDKLVKKYLFKLADNNFVEAVLMEHDYGLSLCVSSQVGCNMACSFCESGRQKKIRNLETYEMVEQILLIEEDIKARISSVVIMGIGEPFDNYDNVMDFIYIINDAKGLAIGARHITISTCGIIPKIEEFMEVPLQVNLAISLHAATDNLRSKLMPINKVYSLSKLISIIKSYIDKTNRRVTLEYVMLENINDSEEDARVLANLIRGMNVYVNLIPYNETSHIEFKKSNKDRTLKFYNSLKLNKINVTIRREFGTNIDAACGQLRSKEVGK